MKAYTYRHGAVVFVSNVCRHRTSCYLYTFSDCLITFVRVSKCHIGVHQMAKLMFGYNFKYLPFEKQN